MTWIFDAIQRCWSSLVRYCLYATANRVGESSLRSKGLASEWCALKRRMKCEGRDSARKRRIAKRASSSSQAKEVQDARSNGWRERLEWLGWESRISSWWLSPMRFSLGQ